MMQDQSTNRLVDYLLVVGYGEKGLQPLDKKQQRLVIVWLCVVDEGNVPFILVVWCVLLFWLFCVFVVCVRCVCCFSVVCVCGCVCLLFVVCVWVCV